MCVLFFLEVGERRFKGIYADANRGRFRHCVVGTCHCVYCNDSDFHVDLFWGGTGEFSVKSVLMLFNSLDCPFEYFEFKLLFEQEFDVLGEIDVFSLVFGVLGFV